MRPQTVGQLVAAPLLLRVAAWVIDALIILILTIILDLALFGEDVQERESLAMVMIVMAVYHIGFLVSRSATPGKAAVGLSVVDRQGMALQPDRAILRYLVYFIGGSVLGLGTLVSVVLVIVDRQRRALHDRVAGTVVVRGRPQGTPREDGWRRD
jgi:uncharacterized RDD family membrane protein YckC